MTKLLLLLLLLLLLPLILIMIINCCYCYYYYYSPPPPPCPSLVHYVTIVIVAIIIIILILLLPSKLLLLHGSLSNQGSLSLSAIPQLLISFHVLSSCCMISFLTHCSCGDPSHLLFTLSWIFILYFLKNSSQPPLLYLHLPQSMSMFRFVHYCGHVVDFK